MQVHGGDPSSVIAASERQKTHDFNLNVNHRFVPICEVISRTGSRYIDPTILKFDIG
jgi:hypothetical protein